MIWLILGAAGIAILLAALVLAPVWTGGMTLKESLLVTAGAIALTGFAFLASWAFAHGLDQVTT